MWVVKNRTLYAIFKETILIVCTYSNSGKGKAGKTFYWMQYYDMLKLVTKNLKTTCEEVLY